VRGEFDVAGALQAFRRVTGTTQVELAAACRIDQPTLSKLERGKLRATLPVARRISAEIGVPLGAFGALGNRSAA
jgi:transcriptional regulator with XRE-family HTH domain